MEDPSSESAKRASAVIQPCFGAQGPALGTTVSADLEALRNDVEQARQLACEYQHQLAGKTNDHAELKHLFEKTREDLVHLRAGVTQLREERHQFANDAMKAAALELKLARITAERDRLLVEVQELRSHRPVASASVGPPSRTDAAKDREFISVPFFETGADLNVTLVPTEASSAGSAKARRR